MGYKVRRKTIVLRFEDPDLAQIEVRARTLSLGRLLEIADLADRVRAGAGLGEVRDLVAAFADALESWNLEDEELSVPIPKTVDGVLSLDSTLSLQLLMAWFDGMASVNAELGKGSISGSPFPEVPIPMEPLSQNPES